MSLKIFSDALVLANDKDCPSPPFFFVKNDRLTHPFQPLLTFFPSLSHNKYVVFDESVLTHTNLDDFANALNVIEPRILIR